MEWITTRTWDYERQAKECWHLWFAWYPVTLQKKPDGAEVKVWLKTVLRKGTYNCSYADCCWDYKYKERLEASDKLRISM